MKDLSQRCIFSGSSDNLNTIMEITLDGEKYKVSVSDEHEDEASLGAIKKLIPERIAAKEAAKAEMLSKLDQFKELAAELGFDLVKRGEKPTPPPPDPNALADKPTVKVGESTFKLQKNTRQNTQSEGLSRDEAVAALEAAKREAQRAETHARPTSGEAANYASHQIPEQVKVQTSRGVEVFDKPIQTSKQMQTVAGAAGIPTTIPRNIQGSDGETTITVVNTGGDKTIQMRGRQLHPLRMNDEGSFYSGECRPCRGAGIINTRKGQKQCKSCGGVGIII